MRARYEPIKNPVGSTGNGFELFIVAHYLVQTVSALVNMEDVDSLPGPNAFVRTLRSRVGDSYSIRTWAGILVPDPRNYSGP
jgi:hypothetical protein